MVLEPVHCPIYNRTDIVKRGKTAEGKQRYKCRNFECTRHSFVLEYSYRGYLPQVTQQIFEMALNGSGIRNTAQVLKINPTTVIEELKKDHHLEQVNQPLLKQLKPTTVTIAKPVEELRAQGLKHCNIQYTSTNAPRSNLEPRHVIAPNRLGWPRLALVWHQSCISRNFGIATKTS